MPLKMITEDIVSMKVDAIVNAANHQLAMGGGVCGAIFRAAGALELQRECRQIGGCGTGEAVMTGGYNLPAKKILHTVGPVWQGGQNNEAELLAGCYASCLALAAENSLNSVVFPLISAGVFGYPKAQAALVAVKAIGDFLATGPEMEVFLDIFTGQDEMIEPELARLFPKSSQEASRQIEAQKLEAQKLEADEEKNREAVSPTLYSAELPEILARLMRERNLSSEVLAKKSNLTLARLSSLLNGADYFDRLSLLALCAGLSLTEAEAREHFASSGLDARPDEAINRAVFYFLNRDDVFIHQINLNLFCLGLPILV
ncbi:MAG: macro domain-containing protein [Deltaproteobacteria bacterium]|nr:macro domain-containing protein [Deltaproteobacteria bacterium]